MRGSLVRCGFPRFPTFRSGPFRRMERFFDDDFFAPFRALERRVKGGLGIMADDQMAGIYAGLATWGALVLIGR